MVTEQKTLNEVSIDLEGKEFEKEFESYLIPEDSYDGEIVQIGQILTPSYENPQTKETKIIFSCLIQEKVFLFYVKPKITKGRVSKSGKSYSNSKLYDVLDKGKLLDQINQRKEELKTFDGLQHFLSQNLIGKKARLLIKTRNKGQGEKEYSSVAEILRFI